MSLKALYEKVQDFESRQSPSMTALSQCQKGCSKCCHVDIGVFAIEANNIRQWFQSLGSEKKQDIVSALETEKADGACAFLRNDACTIYEARPLICRTQGMPMLFTQDTEQFADICPLNESMLSEAEEQDYLNLDLVNLILSRLETAEAGATPRPRIRLADLCRELKNSCC